MKNRTRALPLLVVVAVVALVVGTFGTANAAGLTKQKVQSIATKIIKKQAPSLSVANAANATNAANLNGQPASKYLTTQYQFRLPTQAAAPSRSYSFPSLPAGNYYASYSVLGNSTSILCYFQNSGGPYEAISYGHTAGSYTSVTNSAFLQVNSSTRLNCSGNAFVLNQGGSISNVTFTPIDVPVTGAATGTGSAPAPSGAAANN